MNPYWAIGLGILSAGIGGELFVRGVIGFARWARIPAALAGVTLAAFATSSPELAVALTAAWAGTPQISLGDALGSNVANLSLILAVALLFSSIRLPANGIRRDFSIALLTPVLIGLLSLDGLLSRVDGLLMLALFIAWLLMIMREAYKVRLAQQALAENPQQQRRELFSGIIGLIFLVVAGRLIVTGAKGIATDLGIDTFVIGATVVAIATGIPELATTFIARLRGYDEVGLGNLYGSNIFNGLLIVALVAIITPITISWAEIAVGLGFGILTTALTWPVKGHLWRVHGIILLLVYVSYLIVVWQQGRAY